MRRYFAFLRAVNVGGHVVKMEALRQLFLSFGFSDVETFIASGNVIFETNLLNTAEMENEISSGLRKALGYEVATFVRSQEELKQISTYKAFDPIEEKAATAYNIAFLSEKLNDEAKNKLMSLTTDIDKFSVRVREVFWLCQKKQSESTFSNAVLEKTLGIKSTIRGVNTIRKLVEKYAHRIGPGPGEGLDGDFN